MTPFLRGRLPNCLVTGMDTDREALAAKTDELALENLIESHKQWMLSIASDVTHRYITDSDDEWSVALMAFSEAVQAYEEEKGSFRAFASVVIKRRLLDHIRSQWRHQGEIHVMPGAFDGNFGDEESESPGAAELEAQSSVARLSQEAEAKADAAAQAREEIAAAQELLKPYGFSFFDLADASPHAEKTKAACAQAVKALLGDAAMMASMKKNRALPMKELEAASGVKRKLLDRHRRYIIAAAEILSGDYPVLAEYLGYIRNVLKGNSGG